MTGVIEDAADQVRRCAALCDFLDLQFDEPSLDRGQMQLKVRDVRDALKTVTNQLARVVDEMREREFEAALAERLRSLAA